MPKPRGTTHTTLTETAKEIVSILKRVDGVKMIAPGMINVGAKGRGGKRFVTVVYTHAGFELIVTGQSIQKIAVHTLKDTAHMIVSILKNHKHLTHFTFKERDRKPGV